VTRALLVLLLVGFGFGCGGGAKSLRLPTFTPAVAQATVVDEKITSRHEVHADTEVIESRMIVHRRAHRRVVAVEGSLVVRNSVRYEVDETTTIDASLANVAVPGPLAGKSYEVWRENDALEAKHSDGSPITAEERTALGKAFSTMGTTSAWESFLTGRAWTRGETIEVPTEVLAEFPLVEGDELHRASIAWVSLDGSVATFRATYAYTTAQGFEMEMTSEQRVDRVTGIEVGNRYEATVRGTADGHAWVQEVEAVTTYEAE